MLRLFNQRPVQFILAGFALVCFLVPSAAPALAQDVGDFDDLTRVPIIHKDEGALGITADSILRGLQASVTICSALDQLNDILDTVGDLGDKFGGWELIGAGSFVWANLQRKLYIIKGNPALKISGILPCYNAARDIIKNYRPLSLVMTQKKQTALDDIERRIQIMERRRDDLETQVRIAKQGFWRAILTAALLKTTKTLAERVTHTMMNKFKINDYGSYADALVGQIYTGQRILDSSDDKGQQVLLHSLLTNPLVKKTASGFHPGVVAKAQVAAGDFENIDIRSPDWYIEAAKQGSCEANPFCQDLIQQDRVSAVTSQAKTDASSNIAQSNGYKDPWTCKDNVAAQARIKQEYDALLAEYNDRKDLYEQLSKTTGASQADINKAYADMFKAANKLSSAPETYDTTTFKLCQKIASPSFAIANGLDKLLATQINHIGDYKDANLPVFMKLLSGVISSFANKLILGGNSGGQLILENGALNKAIGTTISGVEKKLNDHVEVDQPKKAVDSGTDSAGAGGIDVSDSDVDSSVKALELEQSGGVLGEKIYGPVMPRGPGVGNIQTR